jgi:hypothetical protein
MPEVQFFQTRMGQRFFEHTMPELVRRLTRLNDLLERIATKVDAVITQKTSTP